MTKFRLKINKTKFVKLLWDRGYRTTVHAARFWRVPPLRAASRRLEWFVAWNSPVGNCQARIYWKNSEMPVLWVVREGVVVRAEGLTEHTLKEYKMILEV